MQYGFCIQLCFADSSWLLVERPFTKNQSLWRDCLEHHGQKLTRLCGCMKLFKYVCFIDKKNSKVVDAQTARAVTRVGSWLARLNIHWHRVMSSPIVKKVYRNFTDGLHFIAENQIFLPNSFFSKTDSHMFLYWLIKCLHVNRMPITNFWYRGKLCNKVINYILIFPKYFT